MRASTLLASSVVAMLVLVGCSAEPPGSGDDVSLPAQTQSEDQDSEATTAGTLTLAPQKMVDFDFSSLAGFGCAVMESQTLWCWGSVPRTDFEDGFFEGVTGAPLMRQVEGVTGVVAVRVNQMEVCVLGVDDSIRCSSDLPLGDSGFQAVPESGVEGLRAFQEDGVPDVDPFLNSLGEIRGLSDAQEIAAGITHTCALLADSTVSCWGYGQHGALGIGRSVQSIRTPTAVPGLSNIKTVKASWQSTCALDYDGELFCWGERSSGFPPIGGSVFTSPVLNQIGVKDVQLGSTVSCIVDVRSEVWCWGLDITVLTLNRGQVAQTSFFDSVWKVPGVSNVTQLVVSGGMACALRGSGSVSCWGQGPLGDGVPSSDDFDGHRGPVTVTGISNAVSLAAFGGSGKGFPGVCAVLADGTLACWGDLQFSGFFEFDEERFFNYDYEYPTPYRFDAGERIVQASLPYFLNESGQLKLIGEARIDPASAYWQSVPVGESFSVLSTRGPEMLCVESAGRSSVACSSAAGLRGQTGGRVFEWVEELSGYRSLSSQWESRCAVLADGDTWCWGNDPDITYRFGGGYSIDAVEVSAGELSDFTNFFFPPRRIPIPPATVVNVSENAFGDQGACAVTEDAELWCWGWSNPMYQWFSPQRVSSGWSEEIVLGR